MSGHMEIGFTFNRPQPQSRRADPDDALKILIVGDLSGRRNRGVNDAGNLADRRIANIDVDNYDQLLEKIAPRLSLPLGPNDAPVEFAPTDLDDFHPDSLFDKLEVFQSLRGLRKRLSNSDTFAAAAAELGGLGTESSAAETESDRSEDSDATPDDQPGGGSFESLLGQAAKGDRPPTRVAGHQVDIDQLVKDIVAPHVVPSADPRQAELIDSVDKAISTEMRRVLHDPDFQQLEGAWRGLRWLISQVETDEELRIAVFDVSAEELAADFAAAGDQLESSGAFRTLVERPVRSPGGQPWSAIIGLDSFSPAADDLQLLACLGTLAREAGCAYVAGATPRFVGADRLAGNIDVGTWELDDDAAGRWQELRKSPAAAGIGLVMPRMLLRQPYGKASDEIERFDFEELMFPTQHDAMLWGCGSLAVGLLIAQAFRQSGWQLQPGDVRDVGDLPAYTYREDGEAKMQACAEAYLSERAGEALMGLGLMPLMSYRGRDAACLMRFQSIADPPAGLNGPWS